MPTNRRTNCRYGAAFGGVAALLTMLNSCASGVSVMNIDNGFGAAMVASKILRKMGRSTCSAALGEVLDGSTPQSDGD